MRVQIPHGMGNFGEKGRLIVKYRMMMMMIMMRGFVERVINSPQTRCRSAKQVGLQMSSERQRGESCSSQSGW